MRIVATIEVITLSILLLTFLWLDTIGIFLFGFSSAVLGMNLGYTLRTLAIPPEP